MRQVGGTKRRLNNVIKMCYPAYILLYRGTHDCASILDGVAKMTSCSHYFCHVPFVNHHSFIKMFFTLVAHFRCSYMLCTHLQQKSKKTFTRLPVFLPVHFRTGKREMIITVCPFENGTHRFRLPVCPFPICQFPRFPHFIL